MSEEPSLTLEAPEEEQQASSPPERLSESQEAVEVDAPNEARLSQDADAPEPPPKSTSETAAGHFSEVNLAQAEVQAESTEDQKQLPDEPHQDAPQIAHSDTPSADNAPAPTLNLPDANEEASSDPQRTRSDSIATTLPRDSTSSVNGRPLLSGVLMQSALEQILASKEARKNANLKSSVEAVLSGLKNTPHKMDSRALLHPLKLACDTGSNQLCILSLDCIGKLVTFSAATPNPEASSMPDRDLSPKPDSKLAEEIVDLICDCFIEAPTPNSSNHGPEAVNLHILSALLSLILSPNPALPVHQSSLLKAVRTVYNIFLLSKGQQNQMVAQGALGQMVTAVFSRVSTEVQIPTAENSNTAPEDPTTPRAPQPAQSSQDLPQESAEEKTAQPTDGPKDQADNGPDEGEKEQQEAPSAKEEDETAEKEPHPVTL